MKPRLRARLLYICKISENLPDEDILTILKTVIQEYEGTLPATNLQKRMREVNQKSVWRNSRKAYDE